MTDIKASEILLEMDKRLSNLENQQTLISFQLKLIIDNFNKFFKQEDNKQKEIINQQQQSQEIAQKSQAPKEESIIDKKKRLMTINKTVAEKIESGINFKIDRRNVVTNQQENQIINNEAFNGQIINEKKVPVTQKLILYDGNPMIGAHVTIRDTNEEIVKAIETSANGRWQTLLSPGKYSLHVSGNHMGNVLEFNQLFEVPAISSPLDLPAPQVYKRKSTTNR